MANYADQRQTTALVTELHLTEVEVDEFWSFVKRTGALPARSALATERGSAGAA